MTSIRLVAAGDLQLGDSATCVGFGFRSRVPATALGSALKAIVSSGGGADLVFANLETPLSDVGLDRRVGRSRQLRGSPEYASAIASAGFNVLAVANNHSLEHGVDAFEDSVRRVTSRGIQACGRSGSNGWTAEPVIRDVRGLVVGVLAYSMRQIAGEPSERPYALATEDQVIADVLRLRPAVGCLIVSLHWGEEFSQRPSREEVAMAHRVADAGATLILGHHPHVARPVERYGRSVIAYSMGNCAADMLWYEPLRRGLVLECTLSAGGVDAVRAHGIGIRPDYLPKIEGTPVPIVEGIEGLDRDTYVQEARRTVGAQRKGLYRYTLRNAWRFDPGALFDLARSTLKGKLAGLTSGKRDEIWG